jgi:hypothetical protein
MSDRHLLNEGFNPEQISRLRNNYGVRSVSQAEALKLGFKLWDSSKKQWCSSAGIFFPFSPSFAQLRCDTPLIRNGKPVKYLTPVGVRTEAFLPEGCRVLTEGFKDAIAGSFHGGIPTGALAGVSHYRKALKQGCGHTILFDADGWTNPQVFANLIHAGVWCRGKVVLLPEIAGQPKAGLCEYFKGGYTGEDYQRLIDSYQFASRHVI